MHCPSAQFPAQAYRFTYQFALFSLAMNSHLIRAGEGPTIKFTAIENFKPTETVIFLDNRLEGEAMVVPEQEIDNLGQPSSFADRFSPRHSKGGNLAFADGHVTWFPGNKVVETNPNSPLRGGPILPEKDIIWELPYR
jgi:prepilin-type processing-associated H-X9-DG protein